MSPDRFQSFVSEYTDRKYPKLDDDDSVEEVFRGTSRQTFVAVPTPGGDIRAHWQASVVRAQISSGFFGYHFFVADTLPESHGVLINTVPASRMGGEELRIIPGVVHGHEAYIGTSGEIEVMVGGLAIANELTAANEL